MAVLSRLANFVAKQITTPAAAPVGSDVLYPKSDDKWYSMGSDGIERPVRSVLTARVATTSLTTLSGTQTIDDIVCVAGDRVLVHTNGGFTGGNAYDNGIWVVAAGAWTRAIDANNAAKLAGAEVVVAEGTIYRGSFFVCTMKATDTLGTSSCMFYAQGSRVELGGAFNLPFQAAVGHAFLDNTNRLLQFWNGFNWRIPKGIQDYSSTAPSNPITGELWYDSSDTGTTSLYDSGWITPTLLGTWVNYSVPGYPATAYRKINGIVYIQGLVKSGAALSNIFTLPAGFRPPTGLNLFNGIDGANTTARIDVDGASGNVIHQAGNVGYISLNGIRFPADN